MLKYYFIADEFRPLFSEGPWPDSQDWMRFAIRKAAKSRTTETQQLQLPGNLPGCYAKCYRYPRKQDRFRIFWRGGFIGKSRAQVEFENLCLLHKRNLAPRVVVFAEKRRFGMLMESLLIVEEVANSIPFQEFVALRLHTLTLKKRQLLIDSLAIFTRRMNANRFINSEFHWRNLMIAENNTDFTFQIIDPSGRRRRYQLLYPFFDLATLDVCAPFFFTRSERLRFYKIHHDCQNQPLNPEQKNEIKRLLRLREKVCRKELKRYRDILPAKIPQ